jgi:uncharacterized protein YabE (DUF348 family)
MKAFLKKYQQWLFPSSIVLILVGLILIWFGLVQTNTVLLAGGAVSVRTYALRVSRVLQAAGITPSAEDRVLPDGNPWFWRPMVIRVQFAREVLVITPDGETGLHSAERIPANLIGEIGIALFPHDRVLVNGAQIDPNAPQTGDDFLLLQVEPAVPVDLVIDGYQQTIYTDQPTLGAALEAASIRLAPQDRLSEDLMTPVKAGLAVTVRRARPVRVKSGETVLIGLTAATTVGEALVDIGMPLQNLDHTLPPEEALLPEDGEIEVIHVNEEILIMTDEVPYQNDYVEDPDTVLDQVSVVAPGQVGIFASRERIQYQDDQEVWRDTPENWQASEAEDGVLGYGSKVEIQTAVVDGQEIEYWRKISVYATSYSPCRCGLPDGQCCYGSASGLPTQRGLIAVTPNWFNMMKFQQVFVQGYGHGVIGNVGGGARYFNHYWIDLGFSDDDYQSWHHWTTMYFLTPVPAWFPAILPWP